MLRLGDDTTVSGGEKSRARIMYELGKTQLKAGDHANANAMFLGALEQDSSDAMVWEALASSAQTYDHRHSNISALRRALAHDPDNYEILANLGVAYWRSEMLHECLEMFSRCLSQRPNDPKAHHNMGLIYYKLLRSEESCKHLEYAHRMLPDDKGLTSDLSISVLQSGDMQRGMELHEVRWQGLLSKTSVWDMGLPQWSGEELCEDTLLIHHEQGFGDGICWARYFTNVKERHPDCKIQLATWPALLRLFDGQLGIDKVINITDTRELLRASRECQWHIPVMSLLRVTGATFEMTPSDGKPYLRPPSSPGGRRAYRTPGTKLSVGVIWNSSPGLGLSRAKSVPISEVVRLSEVPGVRLYSLQHAGTPQLEQTGAKYLITDLQNSFKDFADLALIMSQLDVVVTACTGPSHLAGALGVRTFLMNPYTMCWRYVPKGTERWYSCMTSVRQEWPDNWSSVIDRIKVELEAIINAEHHQ